MEKNMIVVWLIKIIKIHHSLCVAAALFGNMTVLKRPYTVLHMEIYQILSRPCVSCHLGPGATMLPIWSECHASVLVVMMVEMLVYTEHSSNHLGNNLSEEFWGPRSPTPSRQGRRGRQCSRLAAGLQACVMTSLSELNKAEIIQSVWCERQIYIFILYLF